MRFIVFEGIDGAGKSTLIECLAKELKKSEIPSIVTREPGGSELGNHIRENLLKTSGEAPTPMAELFLYLAARAQHVERLIRPKLKMGWVICDRYTASSVAFQCGGRSLNLDMVRNFNTVATGGLEADLTVLLDLDPQKAKDRMKGRVLDRFESEAADFHNRVRLQYLEEAKHSPKGWMILDASLPPQELEAQLVTGLKLRGWIT